MKKYDFYCSNLRCMDNIHSEEHMVTCAYLFQNNARDESSSGCNENQNGSNVYFLHW